MRLGRVGRLVGHGERSGIGTFHGVAVGGEHVNIHGVCAVFVLFYHTRSVGNSCVAKISALVAFLGVGTENHGYAHVVHVGTGEEGVFGEFKTGRIRSGFYAGCLAVAEEGVEEGEFHHIAGGGGGTGFGIEGGGVEVDFHVAGVALEEIALIEGGAAGKLVYHDVLADGGQTAAFGHGAGEGYFAFEGEVVGLSVASGRGLDGVVVTALFHFYVARQGIA